MDRFRGLGQLNREESYEGVYRFMKVVYVFMLDMLVYIVYFRFIVGIHIAGIL